MIELARRYRPRALDEVVGQDNAVAAIRHHLRSGSNQSLIFAGPSGTGKTSAARIIGADMLCDRTMPISCQQCDTCTRIVEHGRFAYGWYELDAGRHNRPADVEDLASYTLSPGMVSNWVFFIDEIHMLSGGAAGAILKAVEEPGAGAQFIGATTDLASLPFALRKRCKIIQFKRLTAAPLFKLLKKVCELERIEYEPRALDMIAAGSEGSARDALIRLEQVASAGPVTEQLVAEALALGSIQYLVSYFNAVVAGDLAAQSQILTDWAEDPLFKARKIRDYLLHVYNFEVSPRPLNDIVDAAFFQMKDYERRQLVEGIKLRVGRRQLADYWLDLTEAWAFDPAAMTEHANLVMRVHRFHRMLNSDEGSTPTAPVVEIAPAQTRLARTRSAKAHGQAASSQAGQWLSLAQAESIYEAASFLPQHYGELFNVGITLDHGRLGISTEEQAGKLISDLTHELDLRVKGWVPGTRAHWMYVNELRASGVFTTLAVHVPVSAHERLAAWLPRRMRSWAGVLADGPDAWSLDVPQPKAHKPGRRSKVSRHWRLVRGLWAGVDPTIVHWTNEGIRQPLVGLLGVRLNARRALGALSSLRRTGTSQSLGPRAREEAQVEAMFLLSAFVDNAWSHIDHGWELDERLDRLSELAERRDALERVEFEWPSSTNQIEKDRKAEALASLRNSWPTDPHKRRRSWKGWW